MSYQNVLDKLLLKNKSKLMNKEVGQRYVSRRVGRPVVDDKLKAKNFTVCMAYNYVKFLDAFKPPVKKIQGRGRKLRFIIDEFIVMSKRQRSQLKYLQEALRTLQETLWSFSAHVKKGEKLTLSANEKKLITTQVKRVKLVSDLLCFTPRELKKILPPDDWSLYTFCLHWNERDRA